MSDFEVNGVKLFVSRFVVEPYMVVITAQEQKMIEQHFRTAFEELQDDMLRMFLGVRSGSEIVPVVSKYRKGEYVKELLSKAPEEKEQTWVE